MTTLSLCYTHSFLNTAMVGVAVVPLPSDGVREGDLSMFKTLIALYFAFVTMSGCGGIWRGACGDGRPGGSYELHFIASKPLVMNVVECINTEGSGYDEHDQSADQIVKIQLEENDPHDYAVINGTGSEFELVNDSTEPVKLTINFHQPMALTKVDGGEYKIPVKGTEQVDNETISFDVPVGSSWWSMYRLY